MLPCQLDLPPMELGREDPDADVTGDEELCVV